MNSPWTWIFLWIILWIFIWPLFLVLMRKLRGKNHKSPLDVLKERYVKGEIDKKTFEEMKVDIGKN